MERGSMKTRQTAARPVTRWAINVITAMTNSRWINPVVTWNARKPIAQRIRSTRAIIPNMNPPFGPAAGGEGLKDAFTLMLRKS
jgi:hypothetical protein